MDQNLGPRVRQYGASLMSLAVWLVLGGLFLAAGLDVLSVWRRVTDGTTTFTGDPSVLAAAGAGLAAIGAAVIAVSVVRAVRRPVVELYEHGIAVRARGELRVHRFEDIRDYYRASPLRYLAYRTGEGDPWVYVAHTTSRIGRLEADLTQALVDHRVPRVLHEIRTTGSAAFWSFDARKQHLKSWVANTRNLDGARPAVVVSADALTVDGRRHSLDRGLSCRFHPMSETVAFENADGEFHRTHVASLLSLDVLLAVLAELTAAGAPAGR
ncbi:hypothetical protein ACF9IK_31920 [Kitasatospora hibisci]|uniref:hypothetical protein n=1 Tax=Kitasatospora hibisci TaxID=3369522 RepID=UPI003754683C